MSFLFGKNQAPQMPQAAPAMPQFMPIAMPQPVPITIPSPSPQAATAVDPKKSTQERQDTAIAVSRLAQQGGRASTIRAGRKIASDEQEETGALAQQRRSAAQKLGKRNK